MVLVRALEPVFVDIRMRQKGEVFEYDRPLIKGGALQLAEDEPPAGFASAAPLSSKPGSAPPPPWTTEGQKLATAGLNLD